MTGIYALGAGAAGAQATNSGDIVGTVTDPTGARIPEVTITVVNLDTGVTKVITTNKQGLYDTSSIVVGRYSLTFSRPGFAEFERSGITLQVGTTTVNATLKVGAETQQVVVNEDIPLLTTDTGAQSTTLDAKSMQVLPNYGQTWENFAILIPGASGSTGNQGTVNPGTQISANGNLPYSNVLSDGASTSLGTSANSDVNVFETVSEVQISTSAFSAQYGIGGIIFNQVSKGGTSKFHGSAYDYFESSQFNANSYQFNGSVNPLAYFRQNNFGASVGGPVAVPLGGLKRKAFFYFDYDQFVHHGSANGTNDVPTAAVMSGSFPTQRTIYDPTTQVLAKDSKGNTYPIRQSFLSEYGSNAIPAQLQDKVALNFQQFYPTATNHIPQGYFTPGVLNQSTGVLQRNFYAILPTSSPNRRYFGRIDYDINSKNRLTGSVTQGDAPGYTPSVLTFCPVGCTSADYSRLNVQISDVWTISPHFINEARFGFTYQGSFAYDETAGKGYPAQLGWKFAEYDEIPAINFSNTYPYAWIEPSLNQYIYKENVFDPSDVMTLVRGKHLFHFGGEVGIYRNDNTPYAALNPGTLTFSGAYTSHFSVNNGVASQDPGTGAEYADFLLGDAKSWSALVGPEYGARLKNPQVFIQDDYKIRPNLTLNLGLRYQVRIGLNETHGNEGVYDPTVLNTANNTLGAYWYGSTAANGRTSLEANSYATVLPRVGFSYLPHPDMTIRGGFGVYAYNLSLDTYGKGMGTVQNATGSYSDQTNGVTPGIKLSGTGTEFANGTALPFALPGTSPTRFNGQAATYTAYNTPDPKIYQWNLAIEQAIGTNMSFELAYVASHGFDLVFPTDLNQVPTALLSLNDTQYRPHPNYTAINGSTNDAISNYNSLQATIKRRLVQGLSFNLNYTWSHFLDSQDSSGWGSHSGPQNRQYADAPSNYSNSDFDTRNAFKGNIVYELPVGKGRMFLNHNWIADELLGGYQVASTLLLTSGHPFSVFASNQNTYAVSGGGIPFPNYSGANLYPAGGRSQLEWYNPAAFTLPAAGTFGNVRRNTLYGPGIEYVNLSAGKKFDIHESVKLQIRVDATNAFNHPSFGQPTGNLPSITGQQVGQAFTQASFSAAGQITSVQVGGRNLQGGIRLEF